MSNPFPDLPPDEYDALLEDIAARGQVYPVIRDQHGKTIDGHQRERALAVLGIEPHYRVVPVASDTERDALAIVLNTHRRHLSSAQRRDAILRLAPSGMTQREIGQAVGVTQHRVSQVLADAAPVISPDNPPVAEPLTDQQGRPPDLRGGRPRNVAPPDQPSPAEVEHAIESRGKAIAANPEMAEEERIAAVRAAWSDSWVLLRRAMKRIEAAHVDALDRDDLEVLSWDLDDLRPWVAGLEAAYMATQKPRLVGGES